MARPNPRRSVRSACPVLLALAACLLAAPRDARGSTCGRQAHLHLDTALTELAILADAPAEADAPAQLPGPGPRKPCRGASCSGRPAAPAVPVSSDPSGTRVDRWTRLGTGAAIAPEAGSRLVATEPSPRPIRRPGPIERPPRLPSRDA